MPVQLARVLRIDMVRRVDDVAIDDELADVVQVTRNLNSFNLLFTPPHLARDDLAVTADTFRVALRVLILDVDRGGEGPHGVAIDRTQLVIQPAILFRALGQLLEQTMRVNADTNVPGHRADRLEVVVGKLFPTRLAAEQDHAGNLTTHDHRHDEFDALVRKLLTVPAYKNICTRFIPDQRLTDLAAEERFHLRLVNLKASQSLVCQSPDRNATQRSRTGALDDCAASERECTQQQVHRRSHHLGEIASACNLLAQIGQGSECVNKLLGRRLHVQWTTGLVSKSERFKSASRSSFASTTWRVSPSISNNSTVWLLTSEKTICAPFFSAMSMMPRRIEIPILLTSLVSLKSITRARQPHFNCRRHSCSIFSPDSLFR